MTLERRKVKEHRTKATSLKEKERALVLAPDAFKHHLIKNCQRSIRSNREFSIASLELLELTHVETTLGKSAADLLLRAARKIILSNIRDADRLTMLSPGKFLLFLPDTTNESHNLVPQRISKLLSNERINYRHQALHASLNWRSSHSSQTEYNVEEMLRQIGHFIDANDSLVEIVEQSGQFAPLATGDTNSWLERYEQIDVGDKPVKHKDAISSTRYKDLWSDCPVVLRTIKLEESNYQPVLSSFHKKASNLQEVDHPGLSKLTDYHQGSDGTFYLVREFVKGESLTDFLEHKKLDYETFTSFINSLLNSFIYLQNMIPPAILPEINADLFIVKDNSNLVLTDFDLLYLFPSSNGHNSNDSKSKVLKGFRQSIDQLCHFLTQLCARVEASVDIDTQEEEQLAAIKQTLSEIEKDIENYNSIYKVKNALSPIISGLH